MHDRIKPPSNVNIGYVRAVLDLPHLCWKSGKTEMGVSQHLIKTVSANMSVLLKDKYHS